MISKGSGRRTEVGRDGDWIGAVKMKIRRSDVTESGKVAADNAAMQPDKEGREFALRLTSFRYDFPLNFVKFKTLTRSLLLVRMAERGRRDPERDRARIVVPYRTDANGVGIVCAKEEEEQRCCTIQVARAQKLFSEDGCLSFLWLKG